MHWVIAGLIAGVVVYVADYVMWGKVFTKGMEAYGTLEGAAERLPGMLLRSAALSLAFGVLFAFLYHHFQASLWVPPGPLAGMELGTTLWLATIAFETLGTVVWWDRVRRLAWATFWSWLVRMNAAGLTVGLLVR